ncbi:MAG: hypothetical protein J1F32_02945 [Erysipelotrichales bacterium]|nr:hypothetical protein [Erysipelotrichales bacterium]
MKKMKTFLVTMLALCGLTACGTNNDSQPSTPNSENTSTSKEVIWSEEIDADMELYLGTVLPYFELGNEFEYGFDEDEEGIYFYAYDYDTKDLTDNIVNVFEKAGYEYDSEYEGYTFLYKETSLGDLIVQIGYYSDVDDYGNTVFAWIPSEDDSGDTEKNGWTDEEKADMLDTWGFEIPFFAEGLDAEMYFESGSLTSYIYDIDMTDDLIDIFLDLGFEYDELSDGYHYLIMDIEDGIIEVAIAYTEDEDYGNYTEVYGYILYPYALIRDEFMSDGDAVLSQDWIEEEIKEYLETRIAIPEPESSEFAYVEYIYSDEETSENTPCVDVLFLDEGDYFADLEELGWSIELDFFYYYFFGIEYYNTVDPTGTIEMDLYVEQVIEGYCLYASIYRIGEEPTVLSTEYNGEYVVMDDNGALSEMTISNDVVTFANKTWTVTSEEDDVYTLVSDDDSMTLTINEEITLADENVTYTCIKVEEVKLSRAEQGTYNNGTMTVVIEKNTVTINEEDAKVVALTDDGILVVIDDVLYVFEITVEEESTSLVIRNVFTEEEYATLEKETSLDRVVEDVTFDLTSMETSEESDAKVVFEKDDAQIILEKGNNKNTGANNGLPSQYKHLRVYSGQKLTFAVDGTIDTIKIAYSSVEKADKFNLEGCVVTGGTIEFGANELIITADADVSEVSIQFAGTAGHIRVTSVVISALF